MSRKDPEKRKEYRRKHYIENHEKELERSRLYRESHREQRRKNNREYYLKHRNELLERDRLWRAANKQRIRERKQQRTREQKKMVFDAYGGKCACCGETTFEFLTVDHVNNDGAEHRKRLSNNNEKVYQEIIDSGFPSNFRLLCMNCNWSRGMYGYCPHENEQLEKELDAWAAWHGGRDGKGGEPLESLPLFAGLTE